jgi:hypothetical protein
VFMSLAKENNSKQRRDKMNRFVGIGTLPRNGILRGENTKVLRFTLATITGFNKETKKAYMAYVPCVVFNPSEKTIQLMTNYLPGTYIGLQGNVKTSQFKSKGVMKYSTEVIVWERTVHVVEEKVHAEASMGEEQAAA